MSANRTPQHWRNQATLAERVEHARNYLMNGWPTTGAEVPTLAGLACWFGVGRHTVRAWCDEDEDFAEVVEGINAMQEVRLIDGGLRKDYDGSVTKLLLTRHGYSDKVTQEITGKDGGAIRSEHVIATATPQEAAEVYARLMQAK